MAFIVLQTAGLHFRHALTLTFAFCSGMMWTFFGLTPAIATYVALTVVPFATQWWWQVKERPVSGDPGPA